MEYKIKIYKMANGRQPFLSWLEDLSDLKAKVAIEIRLDRLEIGNFGQCKSLSKGLYELKIDFGPGYRIYFGKIGTQIILLLCGGDKKSQQKDINKAREYLEDYKEEK